MPLRKHILTAALDWGLGHATRMMPVVDALLALGCDVTLAGNGASLLAMKKNFPELPILELPGYGVRYTRRGFGVMTMLQQLPRLKKIIDDEHALLHKWLNANKIDGIVSDNRYGIYSTDVPSVIITHQLQPAVPRWLQPAQPLVRSMLTRYIHRFDGCWVPDVGDARINLSGKLSHGIALKIPVTFIGPLSRLQSIRAQQKNYDVLALLSGVEPQRTLFEEMIVTQLKRSSLRVLLVQGLPQQNNQRAVREGFETISYADATQLNALMASSEIVIARSGYSTVMDVCRMQRKAVLIPTPGQTEQLYLANHLVKSNWCVTASQNRLNLSALINQTQALQTFPDFDFDSRRSVIADWLQTI